MPLSDEEKATIEQHVEDIAVSLGLALAETLCVGMKKSSGGASEREVKITTLVSHWKDLAGNICGFTEYLSDTA